MVAQQKLWNIILHQIRSHQCRRARWSLFPGHGRLAMWVALVLGHANRPFLVWCLCAGQCSCTEEYKHRWRHSRGTEGNVKKTHYIPECSKAMHLGFTFSTLQVWRFAYKCGWSQCRALQRRGSCCYMAALTDVVSSSRFPPRPTTSSPAPETRSSPSKETCKNVQWKRDEGVLV